MGEKRKKEIKIGPTITWRKVNDEAVILNLETSVYYSVNNTGTFIWELLAGGRPTGKIGLALAEEYGISPEDAAADTAEFLDTMAELELTEAR